MSATAAPERAIAHTDTTKLRRFALVMRKAVDVFRYQTADGQPLEKCAPAFGHPGTDSIGAAITIDHAAIAWLLARGFTVTTTAVTR